MNISAKRISGPEWRLSSNRHSTYLKFIECIIWVWVSDPNKELLYGFNICNYDVITIKQNIFSYLKCHVSWC